MQEESDMRHNNSKRTGFLTVGLLRIPQKFEGSEKGDAKEVS